MEALREREKELKMLCEKYPVSIPLNEVAKYLHIKPENLRCAIAQGRVKGAISWSKPGCKNSAYSIQTLPFYLENGGTI
jgi:hypothetical protein